MSLEWMKIKEKEAGNVPVLQDILNDVTSRFLTEKSLLTLTKGLKEFLSVVNDREVSLSFEKKLEVFFYLFKKRIVIAI